MLLPKPVKTEGEKMNFDQKLEKAMELHRTGMSFYKNGDFQKAIKCFEGAIEHAPQLSMPMLMSTLSYAEIGNMSKAKYHAKNALKYKEQLTKEEIVQLKRLLKC